jgi:membrane associated rhomboid family serine protease
MVYTPVGIKCAEHAGIAQGATKVARRARRLGVEGRGALLTKALIAVNVGIFLLQVGAGGGTLSSPSGGLFERFALYGPLVAQGEWWRLVGAAFLHANLIHLALNMFFLWIVGAPVEEAIGRARFALLYLVSGLGGSAGALLLSPEAVTVGASGALFGILGAALVFERQRTYVLGGSALTLVILSVILTFRPGISIGGHLGGFAAGALAALALSRLGRAHAAYGRPGVAGIAGVVAVGIASIAVAYWSVAPYA